jgi:extradiol dioxygenase family protein
MSLPPFHLAFPVDDLDAARAFYGGLLGCPEGRSAGHWVDFDLYVPVPHFGIVLAMDDWKKLAERLESASTKFVIPPTVRFAGQPGEQATMFFLDPAGNALEFKAMADPGNLFARD